MSLDTFKQFLPTITLGVLATSIAVPTVAVYQAKKTLKKYSCTTEGLSVMERVALIRAPQALSQSSSH